MVLQMDNEELALAIYYVTGRLDQGMEESLHNLFYRHLEQLLATQATRASYMSLEQERGNER